MGSCAVTVLLKQVLVETFLCKDVNYLLSREGSKYGRNDGLDGKSTHVYIFMGNIHSHIHMY